VIACDPVGEQERFPEENNLKISLIFISSGRRYKRREDSGLSKDKVKTSKQQRRIKKVQK